MRISTFGGTLNQYFAADHSNHKFIAVLRFQPEQSAVCLLQRLHPQKHCHALRKGPLVVTEQQLHTILLASQEIKVGSDVALLQTSFEQPQTVTNQLSGQLLPVVEFSERVGDELQLGGAESAFRADEFVDCCGGADVVVE